MTKGFRRIGIVLAAPLFAVALLIVGFGAAVEAVHFFDQSKPVSAPMAPAEDASKSSADRLIQKLQDAIDGKLPEPAPVESSVQSPAWTSLLLWSAGLTMTAVLVYLACWSVGWIFAGFAND